MPKGNKTGPWGLGPRTGREFGYCAGYSTPGYTKGFGMGWGRGRGQGWGRGAWFRGRPFYPESYYQGIDNPVESMATVHPKFSALNPEEEEMYLEKTLSRLKTEIETIEKRLDGLQEKHKKDIL